MGSARKKGMIMEIPPKIWDAERMGMVGFNGGGKSGSCPEIAVQQRKTRNISSLRKGL